MTALEVGRVLRRYVLREPLGSGGFCETWLADDTELRRTVTLKIPLDPEYRRLLRSEARILGQLTHPAIVRVHELDLEHDPPFIVEDYVDGVTLRRMLERTGPLTLGTAIAFLTQLLDALAYAHSRGVIHRDIKPANLMVTRDGTLFVLDFGLGKIEEQATRDLLVANTLETAIGTSIAGTLPYMSPEQLTGGPVDSRADCYACGVVLFELLTGQMPGRNELPSAHLDDEDDVLEALDRLYASLVAPPDQRTDAAAARQAADAVVGLWPVPDADRDHDRDHDRCPGCAGSGRVAGSRCPLCHGTGARSIRIDGTATALFAVFVLVVILSALIFS